jgi:uncharacterized membrane protein
MSETLTRTTVKTIAYRLLGSGLTFIIAFIFTGELVVSATISITEFILKPAMYWLHERVWNRISWGRQR